MTVAARSGVKPRPTPNAEPCTKGTNTTTNVSEYMAQSFQYVGVRTASAAVKAAASADVGGGSAAPSGYRPTDSGSRTSTAAAASSSTRPTPAMVISA